MTYRQSVSGTIDILGSSVGSVLVRTPDGWAALTPTQSGAYLRLSDTLYPYWEYPAILPGVDTGWLTVPLRSGWVAEGGQWPPPRARRNAAGACYLDLFLIGGTTTDGTIIGTLPEDVRPDYVHNIVCNASAMGPRLAIYPTGTIAIYGVIDRVHGTGSWQIGVA
jgi:hypothetical protein